MNFPKSWPKKAVEHIERLEATVESLRKQLTPEGERVPTNTFMPGIHLRGNPNDRDVYLGNWARVNFNTLDSERHGVVSVKMGVERGRRVLHVSGESSALVVRPISGNMISVEVEL